MRDGLLRFPLPYRQVWTQAMIREFFYLLSVGVAVYATCVLGLLLAEWLANQIIRRHTD